jgi:hypothetical protein
MSKRLKVSTLHRPRGPLARQTWAKVPQLRLSGRWLQSLGFTAGGRVTVLVTNGAITLTPCPSES